MEHGETERRGGREGSALCMACGVMSMVMKTKDGRQVRESEERMPTKEDGREKKAGGFSGGVVISCLISIRVNSSASIKILKGIPALKTRDEP